MKLICHACKYIIATIEEGLKAPIRGSMFRSKDPKHGFPTPWSPVVTWEHMNCPMCQKRPFPMPDENGVFIINTDEGERLVSAKGVSEVNDEKEILDEDDSSDGEVEEAELEETEGNVSENTNNEPEIRTIEVNDGQLIQEVDAVRTETTEQETNIGNEEEDASDNKEESLKSFKKLFETGEITRSGSWYEYSGKSYRKDELIELLNG